jgi:hypothetical protein
MTASDRALELLLSKSVRGQAASKIELHLHPDLAANVEAYRGREERARQRDDRFGGDAREFTTHEAIVSLISLGVEAAKHLPREVQLRVGLPPGCDPITFE